ncbi:hypothetical protein AS149_12770 [Burkholderia cenocepacia]|nr:hypothetical protein AS149_12770 [Burkholderia cenocepacia]
MKVAAEASDRAGRFQVAVVDQLVRQIRFLDAAGVGCTGLDDDAVGKRNVVDSTRMRPGLAWKERIRR